MNCNEKTGLWTVQLSQSVMGMGGRHVTPIRYLHNHLDLLTCMNTSCKIDTLPQAHDTY